MDCDIVLVSNELSFIVQPRSFSNRRLYQARGVAGVESVTPVYLGVGSWKNPDTHGVRTIFVVGLDPADRALTLAAVNDQRASIQPEDAVIFDELSRPEYGPIADRVRAGQVVTAELNNRELEIAGLFRFGTSFGIDGTVITSETNFLRLFPNRKRGLIEIGLVRVAPGADPARVRDSIRAILPADVDVLTRAAFAEKEIAYWDSSTPIGYVFSFGVLVGMVVGGIIVYQILFADVNDHLPEYATLKAMGYSNGFLAGVVIQQAVILAALGFLPGVAMSLVLYRVSGEATRLPLEMTTGRALFVLGLTVTMCTVSAVMALRKVRSADPAEVF
jgi:putative ABC transport system permease protein